MQEASKTIDDVALRRRAIDCALRTVGNMPEEQAGELLKIGAAEVDDAPARE